MSQMSLDVVHSMFPMIVSQTELPPLTGCCCCHASCCCPAAMLLLAAPLPFVAVALHLSAGALPVIPLRAAFLPPVAVAMPFVCCHASCCCCRHASCFFFPAMPIVSSSLPCLLYLPLSYASCFFFLFIPCFFPLASTFPCLLFLHAACCCCSAACCCCYASFLLLLCLLLLLLCRLRLLFCCLFLQPTVLSHCSSCCLSLPNLLPAPMPKPILIPIPAPVPPSPCQLLPVCRSYQGPLSTCMPVVACASCIAGPVRNGPFVGDAGGGDLGLRHYWGNGGQHLVLVSGTGIAPRRHPLFLRSGPLLRSEGCTDASHGTQSGSKQRHGGN